MRGKTALWLCAALLGAAALVPGVAVAAPGENEYGLDIPSGNGDGQDPTANASGGSGGSTDTAPTDAATTTTPATEPETTDSSDEGGSGGGGGNDKGGGDKERSGEGGSRDQSSLAPNDEATGTIQASDSDDGGFPVILVAIAVLAAAGVGFAVWRLRRGDGVGRPAQTGHSA